MDDELLKAMADLDEDRVLTLVKEKLQLGYTPLKIVEHCKRGVEIVGKRYSEGEYYLSDLIMSEEIFQSIMNIIEPLIPESVSDNGYSIVLGTIEGDIHDLGKNIVRYLLSSSGFKVYDLGVDVSPEEFVRVLDETKAPILGISVLLSFCIGSIKKVVDLLEEAGLRDQVKVVVGGYPANEMVKEFTGVDYCANDVTKVYEICQALGNT